MMRQKKTPRNARQRCRSHPRANRGLSGGVLGIVAFRKPVANLQYFYYSDNANLDRGLYYFFYPRY